MRTKREEIIEKLKEATKELSLKYGDKIVALGLFGSYARGEETEKSDVDMLVIVNKWKRGVERRYHIYDILHKHIKKDITLIDIDLDDANDLTPIHDPHNILKKLNKKTHTMATLQKERRRKSNKPSQKSSRDNGRSS